MSQPQTFAEALVRKILVPVEAYRESKGVGSAGHIGRCHLPRELGEITINGLAELIDPNHPANEVIEIDCPGMPNEGGRVACPSNAKLRIGRFFATLTACDGCRATVERADLLQRAKAYWESVCPESFRDTDRAHPDFPRAQYEQTKGYVGETSLLLLGETRTGKTRLGMWLLKRCLIRRNLHVGVMWEEDLAHTKKAFDRLDLIKKWGRYDLLLLDDCLLTGAQDEAITSFLKSLLDYRQRHKRHVIITSQVTSADYHEQLSKYDANGKAQTTAADTKRVAALLRRINEMCGVPIPFTAATPVVAEAGAF